jgi:hypothetical protein
MKRTTVAAILVLATISPVAQANQVARIQSAPGQSQSDWTASAEYQSFQCPTGTDRGEGVDMNFTTNRSDDYYFAYCYERPAPVPIIIPTPAPTSSPAPTPIPIVETATATAQTQTGGFSSTVGSTSAVSTTRATETSTATASAAAFDYQAFLQMFIAWFQTWFTQFLMNWGK